MDVITNKGKVFSLQLFVISVVACVFGGNFALANSCDVGTPVDYEDSECISVDYSFEQRPGKDYIDFTNWEAQSSCSKYGRVRLKLITNDGWFSRYQNFDDDRVRTGKINGGITSILCCKGGSNSLGGTRGKNICNMSDAVNESTCNTEFKKSPAGQVCHSASYSITSDWACKVTATCPKRNWVTYDRTSITHEIWDVKTIDTCLGALMSQSEVQWWRDQRAC